MHNKSNGNTKKLCKIYIDISLISLLHNTPKSNEVVRLFSSHTEYCCISIEISPFMQSKKKNYYIKLYVATGI